MLSQRENVNCFYMYNLYWAYGEMILSHPEHTGKWLKRWLSILGNDFIADWAYAEMFKIRISRPNRIRFQKSRVTGSWDHKDSVSAKKVYKKIHACVPLSPWIPAHFKASRSRYPKTWILARILPLNCKSWEKTVSIRLKVLSSEMDQAKSGLIWYNFIK